jgi:hypothetical protein
MFFSYSRILLSASALVAFLTLTGCSHGGVQDDHGRPVSDVFGAFTQGEVRLRCNTSCAGAWGAERKNWAALYRNQLWKDLAVSVSEVNFQGDVQYYYLGRAAEELGYPKAASTYYRLSSAVKFKCGWGQCEGVDVPVDAASGLARVMPAIAPVPLQPPAPAPQAQPLATKPPAPQATPTIAAEIRSAEDVPVSSGNSTEPVFVPATDPSLQVAISVDEFTKEKAYIGQFQTVTKERELCSTSISAGITKVGTDYTFLVNTRRTELMYEHLGYALISSAVDSTGQQLRMSVLDRKADCGAHAICSYGEQVAVRVPKSYLEQRVSTGARFRLDGQRASFICEVDGQKVQALLNAVKTR